MPKLTTWLLAGAALSLTAGAALAHDPKDAGERAERRVEKRVHVHRGGPHGGDFVFIRGGRHGEEHLKDILQLRPEQEPALRAYLEASKRDRPSHKMVKFEEGADQRSTLERLAEMETHLAEQQAAMKARIEATRAFYAQLDAKQKKAFDAVPMMMMAGPHFGPMMLPHRIAHMPVPPAPPVAPAPPKPPSDL